MTVNNPLISFLRRHIDISEKHSVLILKNTYVKEYTPLDFFFEKDQKNDRIAFVISGVFRSYFRDKEGNEITSNFIKENEIVGDAVSFQLNSDRTQENIYIQAETYCKVVVFSKESRDQISNLIPNWESGFQKIITEILLTQINFQRSIINLNAKDSYLLFMKSNPTILQYISLNHLATYLGITATSLSRIRKDLF